MDVYLYYMTQGSCISLVKPFQPLHNDLNLFLIPCAVLMQRRKHDLTTG